MPSIGITVKTAKLSPPNQEPELISLYPTPVKICAVSTKRIKKQIGEIAEK